MHKWGINGKLPNISTKAKIRKEARYNMGLILMQNGEYAKSDSLSER